MAETRPGRPPGVAGRRSRFLRILVPLLALALLAGACGWYLGTYSHAEEAAVAAFAADHDVQVRVLENGDLVFGNGDEDVGLIFYPGGRVDETAYDPLMRVLAENGVFCVICRMPCHLAVLDGNAADGIREAFPQVGRWYLGGHSLGGVMAASYLEKHDGFAGLILLGAYSSADLSDRGGLAVLSVYGSEDGVLDRGAYARSRSNLPAGAWELVIEGGCHAGFGMYGPQRGDGTPAVSSREQILDTAEAILSLVYRGEG